jgi:hypothetical protein
MKARRASGGSWSVVGGCRVSVVYRSCRSCGLPVNRDAPRCPRCGGRPQSVWKLAEWIADLLAVALLVFVAAALVGTLGLGRSARRAFTDIGPVAVIVFLIVGLAFFLPLGVADRVKWGPRVMLVCLGVLAVAFVALINYPATHGWAGGTGLLPW